jgi:hypothetical protein
VVWKLVPRGDLSSADFDTDGIVFPSTTPPMPPNVSSSNSALVEGAQDQWTVTIENWVTDVNSFHYDISVQAPIPGSPKPFLKTVHDPTIVVTLDPIG